MQDKKTNRTWVPEAMLYSKTIKAGRRVYYIDVKQDSKDEYYLSITESKRTQEGSETSAPVFEKHKIFLYREDIVAFLDAFTDAAQYISNRKPLTPHEYREDSEATDENANTGVNGDFDVEF